MLVHLQFQLYTVFEDTLQQGYLIFLKHYTFFTEQNFLLKKQKQNTNLLQYSVQRSRNLHMHSRPDQSWWGRPGGGVGGVRGRVGPRCQGAEEEPKHHFPKDYLSQQLEHSTVTKYLHIRVKSSSTYFNEHNQWTNLQM